MTSQPPPSHDDTRDLSRTHASEATLTWEGWYALHDFRHIDWTTWHAWQATARNTARNALQTYAEQSCACATRDAGSTAFYSILGHKADVLFLHLRPTLAALHALQQQLDGTALAPLFKRAYSYVSVVEVSNYMFKPGTSPHDHPEMHDRLYPILPSQQHICFYPMNKKRSGEDNWYVLPVEQRRSMMRKHGQIGRAYAGKVKQMITGSMGLDDWEWGVTLFAEDPLAFKKLVYDMRYDEVSARYGEFGSFFVGMGTPAQALLPL